VMFLLLLLLELASGSSSRRIFSQEDIHCRILHPIGTSTDRVLVVAEMHGANFRTFSHENKLAIILRKVSTPSPLTVRALLKGLLFRCSLTDVLRNVLRENISKERSFIDRPIREFHISRCSIRHVPPGNLDFLSEEIHQRNHAGTNK